MLESHNPAGVPAPVGEYVQGLALHTPKRLLLISGQIPETSDGTIPLEFEAQCRLVWAHIGATLRSAGMTYGHLLKVTTFLTDRRFAETNGAVRREALGGHRPALTVVVAQTLDPKWLLEIEAIAGMSD